jgi:hypothetical protein
VSDKYGAYYVLLGCPFWWVFSESLADYRRNYLITKRVYSGKNNAFLTQYLNMLTTELQTFKDPETLSFRQAYLSFYKRYNRKQPNEENFVDLLMVSNGTPPLTSRIRQTNLVRILPPNP